MNLTSTLGRRMVFEASLVAVFVAVLCAACLACQQPAYAKSYAEELRLDMPNGVRYVTTTFSKDLTRDGKKDAVKVKPLKTSSRGGARGIRVYVKGRRALTVKSKFANARYTFYYVHMGKKLEFLAIGQPRGKNDVYTPGKLLLYRYSKGKLSQVADLSQKWGVLGTPSQASVREAGKKSITVTATFEKSPLGARSYPLSYSYDKNTKGFELATKSAKPVIVPRHWTASVKRALRKKAAGSRIAVVETNEITGETTTSRVVNKKVATMKKGAKVTGVTVHRDGYIKVKLSNGKSGWFKWATYKKGRPFKEVGAGY